MAERSFKNEVEKLRLGDGEEFRGEGILAVTKALLQSGVSYVSGYQGAPISHLVDVLADANDILQRPRRPLRGERQRGGGRRDARRLDQLSAARRRHLQIHRRHQCRLRRARQPGIERRHRRRADHRRRGLRRRLLDHAGAQPRLRDEVADLAARSAPEPAVDRAGGREELRAVGSVQHAGDAGVAHPRLPRLRQLHRTRQCAAAPSRCSDALEQSRYATPTASCCRPRATCTRREKIEKRWPAAVRFIEQHKLNEFFDGDADDIGIVMQGGMYNTALRALEVLGLADVFGESRIPLYVLNVTYPLIDAEFVRFCAGKNAILIIEEGQPEFIEQAVNTILRRADIQTRIEGKGMLPMAGEYTGGVMKARPAQVHRGLSAGPAPRRRSPRRPAGPGRPARAGAAGDRRQGARPAAVVLHRLSGAADLRRHEAGRARARSASRELRHRLPPVLDPAAVQHRQHHHGLRPRRRRRRGAQRGGRQARHRARGRRRLLAQRPRFERRQCRVQQERQRPDRGRQRLFGRDRRAGRAVLRRRQRACARPRTRSRRRCAASASTGCARSRAPTTSPRCATRCKRRSPRR